MSKVAHLSSSIAAGQVALVSLSKTIDPDGRGTWDYTYEGTDDGIGTLAELLRGSGAKVRPTYDGGKATLAASFAFDAGRDPSDTSTPPAAETPTDRYSVKFGVVQVSLFAHPYATLEAEIFKAASSTTTAQYKKIITDHVNEGTALELPIGTYPFAHVIFRLLSHGVDYMAVDRPTLRRTRSYSYKYAERRVITFAQYAWTTAGLVTAFAIPDDITAILPANPSAPETPSSSQWGWRIADQDIEYNPATRKWEEVVVWEFAAYDTGLFTIIT